MYPEPLASQISAALKSESPEEILAVAEALVADGRLEDSLEWRKWYVHLRPTDAEQAVTLDRTKQTLAAARKQLKWEQVGEGIEYYSELLASGKVKDPQSLSELRDLLGQLKSSYAAGDEPATYAALHAFHVRLAEALRSAS